MSRTGIILTSAGLAILGVAGVMRSARSRPLWDVHSEKRLTGLHPAVAKAARNFIHRAYQAGIPLRITSAYRSFPEQQALYNQGRSTPGNIVTHARPGRSFHNWGLAIDVVEIRNGQALWNNPRWEQIARIGKQAGFTWGGDWTSFKDRPHFELRLHSINQLNASFPSGRAPWANQSP